MSSTRDVHPTDPDTRDAPVDPVDPAACAPDAWAGAVDLVAAAVGWQARGTPAEPRQWALVGTPDETARLLVAMVRCAQICLDRDDLAYFATYLVATHISSLIRDFSEGVRKGTPVYNTTIATRLYTELLYHPREVRAEIGAAYYGGSPVLYSQYTGCPLAEFLSPASRGRAYAFAKADPDKNNHLRSLRDVFVDVDRARVRAALSAVEAATAWARGLEAADLGPHPSALELSGFLATICGGAAMGLRVPTAGLCSEVTYAVGLDVCKAIQGEAGRPLFPPSGAPPASKRYYDLYIEEYFTSRLLAAPCCRGARRRGGRA